MPAFVGFVGLDGPSWVVGGQEGTTCNAAGSEQGSQALRGHADVQDDIVLGMAEAVVGGQEGPDLIGVNLRRFRHKKTLQRVYGGPTHLPVGCSGWSRIRFRVHLARGQVGKAVGPFLDAP